MCILGVSVDFIKRGFGNERGLLLRWKRKYVRKERQGQGKDRLGTMMKDVKRRWSVGPTVICMFPACCEFSGSQSVLIVENRS